MVIVALLFGAALLCGAWLWVGRAVGRRLRTLPDTPREPSTPVSALELLALSAVLATVLVLAAPLMTRGFAWDELWSAMDVFGLESARAVLTTFPEFNNHLLYSLIVWAVFQVVEPAEWVARLPALGFGMAAVVALWAFARPRFGRGVALAAAAALATNSVFIGYAVSARGYTALAFFATVSSMAFLRLVARRPPDRRDVVLYITATWLGVFTHLMAAAVVVCQVVCAVVLSGRELAADPPDRLDVRQHRAIWQSLALVGALCVLTYTPVAQLLVAQVRYGNSSAFDPLLPLHVALELTGNRPVALQTLLMLLGVGGLAVGWRHRGAEGLYVLLIGMLPLAAIWLGRPEFVRSRFFMFLLPWYALGFVVAVRHVSFDVLGRVTTRSDSSRIVSLGVAVAILGAWTAWPRSNVPRGGFRSAVAALEAPRSPSPSELAGSATAPVSFSTTAGSRSRGPAHSRSFSSSAHLSRRFAAPTEEPTPRVKRRSCGFFGNEESRRPTGACSSSRIAPGHPEPSWAPPPALNGLVPKPKSRGPSGDRHLCAPSAPRTAPPRRSFVHPVGDRV